MVKNLRRGDTVITSGGLVGKVTKVVDDDQVEIEIADGVRVRQVRSMVADVRAKGEPVKDEKAPAELERPAGTTESVRQTSMLYFSRDEGGGHSAHGARGVQLHRSRISSPSRPSRAGRHGRSGAWCSASICRAARTSCSRSTRTTSASSASIRCATRCAARCAMPASTGRTPPVVRGNSVEVRLREGGDFADRARQAARPVAAARRRAPGQRPAHPRSRRCRRRTDPADADAKPP